MKFTREDDKLKAERLYKEKLAEIIKIKSWQRVFAWLPISVSPTETVWLEYYWMRRIAGRPGSKYSSRADYRVQYRGGNTLHPYICPPEVVIIESISDEEYQAVHAPK